MNGNKKKRKSLAHMTISHEAFFVLFCFFMGCGGVKFGTGCVIQSLKIGANKCSSVECK